MRIITHIDPAGEGTQNAEALAEEEDVWVSAFLKTTREFLSCVWKSPLKCGNENSPSRLLAAFSLLKAEIQLSPCCDVKHGEGCAGQHALFKERIQ